MASSEKDLFHGQLEIFVQIKKQKPKEYLVYFEGSVMQSCAKRSAVPGIKIFSS
jgi:hypothetical protein